jgi:hypothetical protein
MSIVIGIAQDLEVSYNRGQAKAIAINCRWVLVPLILELQAFWVVMTFCWLLMNYNRSRGFLEWTIHQSLP